MFRFKLVAKSFTLLDDFLNVSLQKMSTLKPNDLTKLTVLVMWLIEIYLNELGSLRDFGKQSTSEYNNLREQFLQFMSQPLVKVSQFFDRIIIYTTPDMS